MNGIPCRLSTWTNVKEDVCGVFCEVHGDLGTLFRVSRMGRARQSSKASELFEAHLEAIEAERAADPEAQRRQREQVDALIASAERALHVAVAEARRLHGSAHGAVRSLECAAMPIGLARQLNGDDSWATK